MPQSTAELSQPKKPAYPSRYDGFQALFLAAVFGLGVLALLAERYEQAAYSAGMVAAFYIGRRGLENPKPKEEKKP